MMEKLLKLPVAETFKKWTYFLTLFLVSGALALTSAQSTECEGLRTQTQGGWGQKANGNNVATYRDANFETYIGDLVVGCAAGYTITLTTSQAVEDFLPSNSQPSELTQSYVDPSRQDLKNVFAGQVVALALSVAFDNGDPDFATAATKLKDQIIAYGPLAGLSVEQLLAEANSMLGGCGSTYSLEDLHEAVTAVNENYVDGAVTGNFLLCVVSSITSSIYGDIDGNGLQDPNETGLGGVLVTITYFGPDGIEGTSDDEIFTTMTDADGQFEFTGLPAGSYKLEIDESSLPAGYLPSSSGTTDYFDLAPGEASSPSDGYDVLVADPKVGLNVVVDQPLIFSVYQQVTYTYKVQNTGNVDLSDVTLSDSECTPQYVSGDVNGDGILNPGETWYYECSRSWTWLPGESVTTSPTVTATDPWGTDVSDEDDTHIGTIGVNMDVQTDISAACPGDVITVRLISRLISSEYLPANQDFQFINLQASSNLINDGQWWTGGPSSAYWADPSGDYVNPRNGAWDVALDYDDYVDYNNGFNAADWVHEFDYMIPYDQSGDVVISASDKVNGNFFKDGNWTTYGYSVVGYDEEVISVDCGESASEVAEEYITNLNDKKVDGFNVYPTVFNDYILIRLDARWKSGRIDIFDAYGNRVYMTDEPGANEYIDLSTLPSGNYWIRLAKKDDVKTQAVIKIQ